ncbi:MAG: hypothetical protein L0241_06720 [Planctomycetia bacterium]|nr:hypothetical protein [Planctomycetia bacterium]
MRLLALCALVFLTTSATAEDKPEWKAFKPKGGRCSIEAPGKLVTQPVQEFKQGDVKIKLHMFILESDDGKTAYGLGYADFPVNPDADLADKVLRGAQDGAMKGVKGKLVTSRDLKLGKYPGREFTLTLPDKNQYRSRIYLVEGRLYQVIVVGSKDFVASLEARTFLYSFELTE